MIANKMSSSSAARQSEIARALDPIPFAFHAMACARLGRADEAETSARRARQLAEGSELGAANGDGSELTYTYDRHGQRTGITTLLAELSQAGIRFKDLQTRQNSLEDIFVGLVRRKK